MCAARGSPTSTWWQARAHRCGPGSHSGAAPGTGRVRGRGQGWELRSTGPADQGSPGRAGRRKPRRHGPVPPARDSSAERRRPARHSGFCCGRTATQSASSHSCKVHDRHGRVTHRARICHREKNRTRSASCLDMCLDYNSLSYILQRKCPVPTLCQD
ncbi:hypothetical protein MHPYR_10074 [uncultured Mycobacterium sp.]|uniref:Uncharacterized protein n=1 Tax=uncultured Mycobacterium sp. TaxID=171292 RepID=A0A1Y5NV66_9MYCO|nr:hypothetical protein MHPYR_10074 [uncultured Mycobacterium sp.]